MRSILFMLAPGGWPMDDRDRARLLAARLRLALEVRGSPGWRDQPGLRRDLERFVGVDVFELTVSDALKELTEIRDEHAVHLDLLRTDAMMDAFTARRRGLLPPGEEDLDPL